jgi:MFS family permease
MIGTKMLHEKIALNIPKLLIYQAFRWFLLVMPTIVLYFQDNGLSMSQVLMTQATFAVSMLIFEVPSGYFSDKLGRKLTLLIGTSLSAFGMLILGLSTGLAGFLIGEVFLGIGASFVSGTDSSLLYDSLKYLERSSEHQKLEGRILAIGNFSESIAGIIGGFIALASIRYSFFIEAGVLFSALLIVISLHEPPELDESQENMESGEGQSSKNKQNQVGFKDFLKEVQAILSHPKRAFFIVMGAFSGLSTFMVVWYVQPVMESRGLPLIFFGFLWAGLNLLVGLASLISHRIKSMNKGIGFLFFFPFLIAVFYIVLANIQGLWVLFAFLPFYLYRGIQGPYFRAQLHKLTPSNQRATSLSLQSLFLRLIFTATGPLFGHVADTSSYNAAFLGISAMYFLLGMTALLIFLFIRRKKEAV